jgi:Flp pilus assembly protein TadG
MLLSIFDMLENLVLSKMRKLARSRKGSTLVMATLLIVIVTVVAGILFYNTIMGSVTSMTNNVNTQMALLLVEGIGINSTTITAFIRNTGQFSVEILNAYVNSQIALLAQTVKIASAALGVTYIMGEFVRGNTYSVQLAGMFGTLTTFQVTY